MDQEASDRLVQLFSEIESSQRDTLRDELVPEAVQAHAQETIEPYLNSVLERAQAETQRQITSAYTSLADQFDGLVQGAVSRVHNRAKDLEQNAVLRLESTTEGQIARVANTSPPPPPPPEPAEWEVSRDNDGRISSLDNGVIRRVPVRDFAGSIVRVVEEPI